MEPWDQTGLPGSPASGISLCYWLGTASSQCNRSSERFADCTSAHVVQMGGLAALDLLFGYDNWTYLNFSIIQIPCLKNTHTVSGKHVLRFHCRCNDIGVALATVLLWQSILFPHPSWHTSFSNNQTTIFSPNQIDIVAGGEQPGRLVVRWVGDVSWNRGMGETKHTNWRYTGEHGGEETLAERTKSDKKVTISTNKHRWEKLLDTTHTPVLSSFNDSYQGFVCRCVAASSGGVYYSNIQLYTLVEIFTDKIASNANVRYQYNHVFCENPTKMWHRW